MEQYRKGRRLIVLCEKKIAEIQSRLVKLSAERASLLDLIERCNTEIKYLTQALNSNYFEGVSLRREDIFQQRRKNAALLHQRLEIGVERDMHEEDLIEIEQEIEENQRQLAVLKRKELKFSRWASQVRHKWLSRQDTAMDDEIQDNLPWKE